RSAEASAKTTMECRDHCARIVVPALHRCLGRLSGAPPLFRGCVVVSNRSSAPRQGRGAASRRGSEGSAGQQPGQGRGSCPGGPQARGGGGRRGGGRRSGASGVVEQ